MMVEVRLPAGVARFEIMAVTPVTPPDGSPESELAARRAKLARLRAAGVDPFGRRSGARRHGWRPGARLRGAPGSRPRQGRVCRPPRAPATFDLYGRVDVMGEARQRGLFELYQNWTSATLSVSKARCLAPAAAKSPSRSRLAAAGQMPASAAREMARPARRGDALPRALCGPDRERRRPRPFS